jgi:hypothetical protein
VRLLYVEALQAQMVSKDLLVQPEFMANQVLQVLRDQQVKKVVAVQLVKKVIQVQLDKKVIQVLQVVLLDLQDQPDLEENKGVQVQQEHKVKKANKVIQV